MNPVIPSESPSINRDGHPTWLLSLSSLTTWQLQLRLSISTQHPTLNMSSQSLHKRLSPLVIPLHQRDGHPTWLLSSPPSQCLSSQSTLSPSPHLHPASNTQRDGHPTWQPLPPSQIPPLIPPLISTTTPYRTPMTSFPPSMDPSQDRFPPSHLTTSLERREIVEMTTTTTTTTTSSDEVAKKSPVAVRSSTRRRQISSSKYGTSTSAAAAQLSYEGPVSHREEKMMRLALEKSLSETKRPENLKPVEAPTLYPTLEEFRDPIKYFQTNSDLISKYGIAKIVPPHGWHPPFSIDLEKLEIETKLQEINRLGEGIPYDDGVTYSYAAYREMADEFRAKREKILISKNRDPKSLDAWEEEYWSIVEGGESRPVKVEYGNDVSSETWGSGFPAPSTTTTNEGGELSRASDCSSNSSTLTTDDKREHEESSSSSSSSTTFPSCENDPFNYRESSWNLLNIPRARGSVLRHLRDRISGVNVPWLYFGMTFSTFSWHYEDNMLFSINYSHHGEGTKIWYGVPGNSYARFDEAMRAMMPVSFRENPDLLSHIVTMVSPRWLLNRGIPVCRAQQNAGEFVVTFPAAYHAGFSTAFNVGEAVNFASVDWIRPGRMCRDVYRKKARAPVIAHDKIVWALAAGVASGDRQFSFLTPSQTRLLSEETRVLFVEETAMRDKAKRDGIQYFVQMPPEDPTSDEPDIRRKCITCNQPCSMSAVICQCTPNAAACPRHHFALCQCESKSKALIYWKTLEELESILTEVEARLAAQ